MPKSSSVAGVPIHVERPAEERSASVCCVMPSPMSPHFGSFDSLCHNDPVGNRWQAVGADCLVVEREPRRRVPRVWSNEPRRWRPSSMHSTMS
jgi:hypothetical protein